MIGAGCMLCHASLFVPELRRGHMWHVKASCRRPLLPVQAVGQPRTPRPPRPEPRQRHEPAPADPAKKAKKLEIWKNQLARLTSNARAVAVTQLLRIEEEGAFVGLVGGSPVMPGTDSSQDEPGDLLPGRWREKLSDRDARLVTEIVAGVTRWRRRLDFVICHLTKSEDVASLDPPLRQILRVALYELLELSAPAHVVNEHVALAKRVMNAGAGGFANGVLRSATRLMEAHRLPQAPTPLPGADLRTVADSLGVATSHPTWLVERWLRQLGRQKTLALLKWNNARPTHSLRISPSLGASPDQLCERLAQQGIAAVPSTYLPREFLRVKSGLQALLATGMVAQGQVQVQDEAAGVVVAMLDPQPGEAILDACAAPGGKTLFTAARMDGRGRILALDVSAPRLQALEATAQRQGYADMVVTHAADFRALAGGPQRPRRLAQREALPDGTAAAASSRALPWQAARSAAAGGSEAGKKQQQRRRQGEEDAGQAPAAARAPASGNGSSGSEQGGAAGGAAQALLRSQFDRVLLDAPCSGTGVLAKRADLRWRRRPSDLRQLAELQEGLLEAAAPWVKPGGVLVYSTCSIEPEENQARVARFLAKHREFAVEPPPAATGIARECLTPEGYLQMLPHVHGTDGAFAARLRRGALGR